MNTLFPIIRRKRRPLLPAETVRPVVMTAESVEVVVLPVTVEPVANESERKTSDAKCTLKRNPR